MGHGAIRGENPSASLMARVSQLNTKKRYKAQQTAANWEAQWGTNKQWGEQQQQMQQQWEQQQASKAGKGDGTAQWGPAGGPPGPGGGPRSAPYGGGVAGLSEEDRVSQGGKSLWREKVSSGSHDLTGGEYWRIWPGLFPFSLRKF